MKVWTLILFLSLTGADLLFSQSRYERSERLFERGVDYYRSGDLDSAETIFSKLYERHPEHVDIGLNYAQILLSNQNMQSGLLVLEELLEKHPEERRVYKVMLDVYAQAFSHQGKVAILERKREAFPQDPSIMQRLAESYELMREWEKAFSSYDTLMTMTYDKAGSKVAMARIREEQNKTREAIRLYQSALPHSKDRWEILLRTGHLYEDLREWENALSVYAELTNEYEHDYPLIRKGRIHEQKGNKNRAFDLYRMAEEMESMHPMPYQRLAMLKFEQDEQASFRYTERALRMTLEGAGRLQQQKYGFLQSLDGTIDPETIRTQQDTHKELDQYREWIAEIFEFLTNSFPFEPSEKLIMDLLQSADPSGRFYYHIGLFYDKHSYKQETVHYFREATELSSGFRDAHLALGEWYKQMEKFEDAILSYERALSIDPQKPDAYRVLIRLYRQQGSLDLLCDRWLARYQANSDNEILQDHLMEALHKAGRYDEAGKIAKDR